MNSSRVKYFLLFLAASAFSLSLYESIFDFGYNSLFLPGENDKLALALSRGEVVEDPAYRASFPLLLSFLYRLFDSLGQIEHRFSLLAIMQSLLFGLNVSLMLFLAQRVSSFIFAPDERKLEYRSSVIGIVALQMFCYPVLQLQWGLLSENWFTPLAVFFLFLSIIYATTNQRDNNFSPLNFRYHHTAIIALCTGVVGAILFCIRPIFLPTMMLWLIWLTLLPKAIKDRFGFISLYLLTFALVTSSVAKTNSSFDKQEQTQISSNLGINFALSWCNARRIIAMPEGRKERWFSPPALWERPIETDLAPQVSVRKHLYYIALGIQCISLRQNALLENVLNVKNLVHSAMYPCLNDSLLHYELLYLWKVIAISLFIACVFLPILCPHSKLGPLYGLCLIFPLSLMLSVYALNPGEERYLSPYLFTVILLGWPALLAFVFRLIPGLPSKLKILVTVIFLLVPASITQSWRVQEKALSPEEMKTGIDSAIEKILSDNSLSILSSTNQGYLGLEERQVKRLLAMLRMNSHLNQDRLTSTANSELRSMIRHALPFAEESLYIKSTNAGDEIYLTSLAIQTILASPDKKKYSEFLLSLGRFLLLSQRSDGSLNLRLTSYGSGIPIDSQISPDLYELTFLGSFIRACVELSQFTKYCNLSRETDDSSRFLAAAKNAFDYYTSNKQQIDTKSPVDVVSSLATGSASLFLSTSNQTYESYMINYSQILRLMQNPLGHPAYLPGAFDNTGLKKDSAIDAQIIEALSLIISASSSQQSPSPNTALLKRTVDRGLWALEQHRQKKGTAEEKGTYFDRVWPKDVLVLKQLTSKPENTINALLAMSQYLKIET